MIVKYSSFFYLPVRGSHIKVVGHSPRGSVASPAEGGRNTSGHPRRLNGCGKLARVFSAKTKFSLKCEPGNLRAGPVSAWRGVCGGGKEPPVPLCVE